MQEHGGIEATAVGDAVLTVLRVGQVPRQDNRELIGFKRKTH
jgi:hypothetical protein